MKISALQRSQESRRVRARMRELARQLARRVELDAAIAAFSRDLENYLRADREAMQSILEVEVVVSREAQPFFPGVTSMDIEPRRIMNYRGLPMRIADLEDGCAVQVTESMSMVADAVILGNLPPLGSVIERFGSQWTLVNIFPLPEPQIYRLTFQAGAELRADVAVPAETEASEVLDHDMNNRHWEAMRQPVTQARVDEWFDKDGHRDKAQLQQILDKGKKHLAQARRSCRR